ncbi:baseplate J/gp47 family protein [Larkinella sp.]|uniref:baseplate J/gp47 family protein n=1 Tax=Larkinella sp. TaxID=2034517 RepID=UPI003BAA88B5
MPQPCPDKNPLQRSGISQPQRRLPALQPENTLLDERKPEDLLRFLALYAQEARIRFFDATNTPDNGAVWADLMNFERYFTLDELETRHDIEPHFALVLAFLHLFEKLQAHQNTLTKRHLDFYYREVLQLSPLAPVPDRVHVLFELAKNAAEQIVPAKTELDAGKDKEPPKQPLIYQTARNLTVNRARISHLRTVFRSGSKVYYAPVANTADGVAEALSPENPGWNGFGPRGGASKNRFPEARLGFALASPALRLAEGFREITVQIFPLTDFIFKKKTLNLRVQLSGTQAWLDASAVTTEVSEKVITLVVTVSATVKEAVVAFDPAKLDGGYATDAPVMRCWLADDEAYGDWKHLRIRSVQIDVKVDGLKKTLALENDLGPVSAEKPFMPFGPTPAVGSTLSVRSDEILAKTPETVTVHLTEWVGLPANLGSYYEAYGTPYTTPTAFTVTGDILAVPKKGRVLFPAGNAEFKLTTSLTGTSITENNPDNLLKISLESDFGHTVYPQKLTQGVIDQAKPAPGPQKIPNPPYTPVLKSLTVDYTATTGRVSLLESESGNAKASFATRALQWFHLAAFGQAEEHGFLKQSQAVYLLPQYDRHGAFFLGLQDVGPQEAVAILFQVEEGSANPENQVPTVEWSVLTKNQWRLLTRDEILSDTTNHLLTSGIIQFLLPKETTTDNTLLETGFVWLRAELKTSSGAAPIDSVCNFVGLHPQAVLANFTDQNNDPAHYDLPLAAETIQKLRRSLAAVKTIKQPYASFGGQPQESDAAYYTRVSERLRHKQRAVSIWDYEHLVLQTFPNVYKVKCLNHTKVNADGQTLTELAPGHVTLVVVPDLRNLKDVNRFEPRVDLNTLSAIARFLQHRAGKPVTIQVTNPRYERVKLRFQVAFRPGFEPAVYKKILQQDLIAYLTPWAFDTQAEIAFGGTIYKSTLLYFMERRDYVDFVTELKMQHFVGDTSSGEDQDVISASDARAVLTSFSEHDITDFTGC